MELKTTAIVLRTTEVGESDKLVTLLTPNHGRMTVRAKGCRGPKSKLRFATMPLCAGEYLLTQSKAGYIITGCDCIDAFGVIGADITKYYVAAVVLEGADKSAREDNPDAPLFLAVLDTLRKVAYHDNPLYTGVAYLVDLMRLVGHAIRTLCVCGQEGDYIDLETGAVCCAAHRGNLCMPLSPSARRGLWALSAGDEVDIPTLRELYVILARCLFHTVGVKLMSVQELCKQWSVVAR